jgi:hypothetical protein
LLICPLQAEHRTQNNSSNHQADAAESDTLPELSIDHMLSPEPRRPVVIVEPYYLQPKTEPDKQPSSFLWVPWDGWVAIFTLVLAVVSIWQGCQIRRGERLTIAALRSSQRQSRAAIRAARAGEKSVERMEETAERQLRAYVGIIKGAPTLVWAETESGGKEIRLQVKIVVKNSGRTPAYKMRGGGSIKFAKSFDEHWLGAVNFFAQNTYILPDAELKYIVQESIEKLNSGVVGDIPHSHEFFFFGRIEYVDAFGKDRWTNFRFAIGGDIKSGTGDLRPCKEGNDAN